MIDAEKKQVSLGLPDKRGNSEAMVMLDRFKMFAGRVFSWLARPSVVFYTLPPLMVLLVAGTVAQRSLGLYQAHQIFFGSFIIWTGPLPLPGAYSLMALIGASLVLHFLFYTPWRLAKAGIHLAHLGVMVLLFGGLLTAATAEEGFILIPEGQSASVISDYHQRELIVRKNDQLVAVLPHQQIKSGHHLPVGGLPFTFEILEACRDCQISKREDAADQYQTPLRSLAQFMALGPGSTGEPDEARLYGMTVEISGAGGEQDGIYLLFEAMPRPFVIEQGDNRWVFSYQRQERALPFSLRLEDFEGRSHPGTNTPASYRSDLFVEEGATSWRAIVEMNKPLRYRGYTFFQSSFSETPQGEATVLTVVKNGGWLFPYIGTALMAIGLLLHVLIRSFKNGAET